MRARATALATVAATLAVTCSYRTLFCAQMRQLREELLAARRDRASGEAREAELRRELSSIKRQVRPANAQPELRKKVASTVASRWSKPIKPGPIR